jgi:hypothetical protein
MHAVNIYKKLKYFVTIVRVTIPAKTQIITLCPVQEILHGTCLFVVGMFSTHSIVYNKMMSFDN